MAPRIITPPREELISFEAFSAAMTNAPLDDLHKTYDSDGEHDLEDNYEGEDSDDAETKKDAGHGGSGLPGDCDIDSDDNTDDDDTTDTSPPYEYFDARFDINRRNLTPNHSKSRHINPELQSLVDDTEIFLEQLSLKFQPLIEEQPMSTSIVLANQAVEQVLMPYRKHGSQARLSESAMRFLSGGDAVRRPGRDGLDGSKDGRLRFVEDGVGLKESERVENLKRKAGEAIEESDAGTDVGGKVSLKIKILKRSDGTSIVVPATPSTAAPTPTPVLTVPKSTAKVMAKPSSSHLSYGKVGYGNQPGGVIQLDGPETQADFLSFRKTSAPFDTNASETSSTRTASGQTSKTKEINLYTQDAASLTLRPRFLKGPSLSVNTTTTSSAKTLFTPLAASFSNVAIKSPTTPPSTSTPSTHPTPNTYPCTIDPLANAALARSAYTPLSLKFSWPASIKLGTSTKRKASMPTPGLLDTFNNILHLYNAEGRALLSYYVHKYDTPAEVGGPPGSPGSLTGNGRRVEPPHALFRLGISQYLQSKVGKMVNSKETDELGLTPEARRVLGAVWERHPSTYAWFDDGLVDESDSVVQAKETTGVNPSASSSSSLSPPTSYQEDSDTEMNDSEIRSTTTDTDFRHKRNLHKFHMGLNPVEKTLLARACNVSVETVDAYWDEMREKTKAWGAMKLWCEVQSRKRINQAKREARW